MGGARGGGMPRREKRRDPLAFSADKKLLAANLRAAPMEGLSLIDVSEPHGTRVQRSKSPRTSMRTQLPSYTRCFKIS